MDALKAAGKKALIPFLMAGDPNLETTAKALKVRTAMPVPGPVCSVCPASVDDGPLTLLPVKN